MTGEKELSQLLLLMKPELLDNDYVFCTMTNGKYGDYRELSPLASYQEKEGLSLVIDKKQADRANLNYHAVFKGIILTIHSSLEAVGLTAVIASELAAKGISANVIAAYYHDYIFVPKDKANLALETLRELN